MLFAMNSSIICFFMPLACREQTRPHKRDDTPSSSPAPAVLIYLNDISRFLGIFFEDQHCRCVTVNIEFFLEVGSLGEALVHIAKLQVVSIGKSCQLWRQVMHRSVSVKQFIVRGI